MTTTMSESSGFVEVDAYKVWFERIGCGPNVVLLIPGAIGTARTDFNELIDGDDQLDFDKFTVIAVDPPGLGKSRPPQRKYGKDVYDIDCQCYHAVMQNQGISSYSVIGWDEGAKVALLMAIRYGAQVQALVLMGLTNIMSNKNINALKASQSVDDWPGSRIENYLRAYESKEEIQKQWKRYLSFAEFYNHYFPEDIFKDKCETVYSPVMFVHGDKDPIVELDQSLSISRRIPFVKVHQFPEGEHDSHQKFTMQFTKLCQDFILNKDLVIKEAIELKKAIDKMNQVQLLCC